MTIPVMPDLPGRAFPLKRSPVWNSKREEAESGKVSEYQKYSYPRWRYDLPFELLRSGSQAELQSLVGFFNSVKVSSGLFQFQDPVDSAATDQAFGVGDGATAAFQLVRAFGGFVEPVFAPIAPITVKIDDEATASFTLGDGGVVTFDAPPADSAVLKWTGTFRWLCRFDDDTIEFQNFMSGRWSLDKLSFTTEKL